MVESPPDRPDGPSRDLEAECRDHLAFIRKNCPGLLPEGPVEPGTPVKVSYSLTEKGADLGPAMSELRAWARRWKRTG